jgi:Concanavalin A-like lectin/glucanases superfamily/Domain of unknown function (DUF2341)
MTGAKRIDILKPVAVALSLTASIYLAGCNTGSETGNPSKGLTGNVLTLDGVPAARTQVILVPKNFNPLEIIDGDSSALHIDTTDEKGRYGFNGVDTGTYNLEARSLANGTCSRIKDIFVAGAEGRFPEQTLKNAGTISVDLKGVSDTATGYVYIPGTTYFQKIASASGVIAFDSVPPGRIDSLLYGSLQAASESKAFAWNLDVLPEASATTSGPYLAWKHSTVLHLDTRPNAVRITFRISEKVAHIPLRFALNSTNFDFSSARTDGSDIRITNENGEPLPCELQLWDPVAKSGEVWVLMDTVFADSLQKVRLHWGYAGAEVMPAAWPHGSVFSLADGYAAAWHLDEDPLTAGRLMKDHSGHRNDGIAMNFREAGGTVSGVLGSALLLDGKTQFLASGKEFTNPNVYTYGGWIKTTTAAGGRIFDFTNRDTSTATNFWDRLIHMKMDGTVINGVYPPTVPGTRMPTEGTYKILRGSAPLNDGQWHHVAARLSGKGQALFVDGVKVAEDTATVEAENINGFWRLGFGHLSDGAWAPTGTSTYFQGAVDEVWITHAERSDDFLKLTFENQRPGSLLLKFP